MKILRSVTRRGFSVGSAGWFTVVSPNSWFAASRLPRGSHCPVRKSSWAAAQEQMASHRAEGPEPTMFPQFVKPGTHLGPPMRLALIALAASAITLTLLWWIARS
jgi:hypothetical protein